MIRPPVDLSAHINHDVVRGHPADFPVALRPVFIPKEDGFQPVLHRRAVVREDNGAPLAVVSDRYTLVPHQRILDLVEEAIRPLAVGPVPRGVFVDRGGARMRALFKFPALAQPVLREDICPCLKVQNTYDGTSRVAVHIGAFHFVCTNLAVGGGGVFAGGFMSVHAGEVAIEKVAEQLASFLKGFDAIVDLYRAWSEERLGTNGLDVILDELPKRFAKLLEERIHMALAATVFEAYNLATYYATHETRSYRTAFELLARVNRAFQKHAPRPQHILPAPSPKPDRHAVLA